MSIVTFCILIAVHFDNIDEVNLLTLTNMALYKVYQIEVTKKKKK